MYVHMYVYIHIYTHVSLDPIQNHCRHRNNHRMLHRRHKNQNSSPPKKCNLNTRRPNNHSTTHHQLQHCNDCSMLGNSIQIQLVHGATLGTTHCGHPCCLGSSRSLHRFGTYDYFEHFWYWYSSLTILTTKISTNYSKQSVRPSQIEPMLFLWLFACR